MARRDLCARVIKGRASPGTRIGAKSRLTVSELGADEAEHANEEGADETTPELDHRPRGARKCNFSSASRCLAEIRSVSAQTKPVKTSR